MSTLRHPGADPSCPTCAGLGLDVVRTGRFASTRACSCRASVCPACKGTGFVSTGAGFRAPVSRCDCGRVADRARNFDAAGIPGRYTQATLQSFRAGATAPALRIFVDKVAAYVDGFQPGDVNRGLVFWGPVGHGKTHLAIGALRALILERGATGRFVEFTHLLADLKLSFERRGAAAELLEPLADVDALVVDELGKGRNTEFEGTVLDELVSRRYNAGTAILGTTNFEPKAATGVAVANAARPQDTPALADRVGDRVYSRLEESCDFFPIKGEDMRARAKATRPRRPRSGRDTR